MKNKLEVKNIFGAIKKIIFAFRSMSFILIFALAALVYCGFIVFKYVRQDSLSNFEIKNISINEKLYRQVIDRRLEKEKNLNEEAGKIYPDPFR
jgi:hypothetical protein